MAAGNQQGLTWLWDWKGPENDNEAYLDTIILIGFNFFQQEIYIEKLVI